MRWQGGREKWSLIGLELEMENLKFVHIRWLRHFYIHDLVSDLLHVVVLSYAVPPLYVHYFLIHRNLVNRILDCFEFFLSCTQRSGPVLDQIAHVYSQQHCPNLMTLFFYSRIWRLCLCRAPLFPLAEWNSRGFSRSLRGRFCGSRDSCLSHHPVSSTTTVPTPVAQKSVGKLRKWRRRRRRGARGKRR